MKAKRKKQRRGISAGTILMLLLTVLVLLASAGFMAMIAGDALKSRASETVQMIEQAGLTLMSEAESAILRREERSGSAPRSAAPQTTAAPEEIKTKEKAAVTFTIAAAGTIQAPSAVQAAAKQSGREYDFDAVFSGLGDVLLKADLAIATLETTLAGEKKGYGSYNAPAQLLNAIRNCGVDVLSVGTEHMLDMGYDGLEMTLGEITARGISHTGAHTDSARAAAMGNIGGVQVAVLGYTYGLSEEGRKNASEQERSAAALLDMAQMESDIRQARADGANVVIVLPHWGTKNKQETPEEVRKMARMLATAGADVILGTHPNVVQGTERLLVTRADGLEYEAAVCYSLGSLLTDARTEENTAGMIAHMQITYDPKTRRVSLGSLACSPVYIARQTQDGKNVYRVVDVESAEAMALLTPGEQEAAQHAAALVREITGQSRMEGEGEG